MQILKNARDNVLSVFKFLIHLLFLTAISFLIHPHAAFAHTPHDVVTQVELSPQYSQDQTLYIIVRNNLLKSTSGGNRWQRVIKGIDNRYSLETLAIAAQDKNTLFVSSLGDGIYKSQDEGNNWTKVNNGLENLEIDHLAISPNSPDVILATSLKKGLYQTNNGGNEWHVVINDAKITAVAFVPGEGNQVFAGDNQGNLYRSDDAGNSWKAVSRFDNNSVTVIAVSPNFQSDNTIFIGTDKGGIFKSSNYGISVSKISNGLEDNSIRDIAILPGERDRLILFVSTWNAGVYRSNNTGGTWRKYSKGLTKDDQADESKFFNPHFMNLRISDNFDQDKTIFLGGFDGLFKTTNAAHSWKQIPSLSPRITTALSISPDYQNDATIAIATYNEEAYISHNAGKKWQLINKHLKIPRLKREAKRSISIDIPRFYELTFSQNYATDKTLFSVLSYKFLRSSDSGQNWKEISIKAHREYSIRGLLLALSPNFSDDQTVYLATRYGGLIYKSTDGGLNFSTTSVIDKPLSFLAISPNFAVDQTLYAGSSEGIYKTIDGGVTWRLVTGDRALAERKWFQLAISPNYKADQTAIAGTDQGLFITNNGGQSWLKLSGFEPMESGIVDALAISPDYENDQTFIFTIKGKGLFRTTDRGKSFTEIGNKLIQFGSLPSYVDDVLSSSTPIKFSPSYATDKTIYGFGSADAIVLQSTDGGNAWNIFSIPRQVDLIDTILTSLRTLNLAFKIYPALRFIAATVIGLIAYLVLGKVLNLWKQLPLKRLHIRLGFSSMVFVIVVVALSVG